MTNKPLSFCVLQTAVKSLAQMLRKDFHAQKDKHRSADEFSLFAQKCGAVCELMPDLHAQNADKKGDKPDESDSKPNAYARKLDKCEAHAHSQSVYARSHSQNKHSFKAKVPVCSVAARTFKGFFHHLCAHKSKQDKGYVVVDLRHKMRKRHAQKVAKCWHQSLKAPKISSHDEKMPKFKPFCRKTLA